MKVTLRVPATSANLGPGFDSLGIAFQLYNTFSFIFDQRETLDFHGVDQKHAHENHLAVRTFFQTLEMFHKEKPKGFLLEATTNVPISRGLGSSSTCIVAGVLAANIYGELALSSDEIIFLLNHFEGHPDNVVPAYLGALVASVVTNDRIVTLQKNVSEDICFFSVVPHEELRTSIARKAMPSSISYTDAVYNISRSSLLLHAFEAGDLAMLSECTKDRLHQPYRFPLIFSYGEIEQKVQKLNVPFFLSGAGSTMIVLCKKNQRDEVKRVLQTTQAYVVRELEVSYTGTEVQVQT